MKNLLISLAALSVLLVGCESSNDFNTKVDANVKVEKTSDSPEKLALLPSMTDIAKKKEMWSSLTEDEKAPFLKFHDNDAAKAEKHFVELARVTREQPDSY